MIVAGRKDGFSNKLSPLYQYDDRLKIMAEVDQPPKSLFMEIGHDSQPGAGEKHYRRYYPDELEQVVINGEKLISSPFINETILRAKQAKSSGILEALFGNDNNKMTIEKSGIFKGVVRCYQP